MKAKKREERNSIALVVDGAGNKYEEEEQIAKVFVEHFESLFLSSHQVDVNPIIDKLQAKGSVEMCEMMGGPYTGEEVYEALFQMHPAKPPGPDGMCRCFTRKCGILLAVM